jgi:ATP-binding cassette subfamily B multidrug efflux pump
LRSLLRLRVFLREHRWEMTSGIVLFFIGRMFEFAVPLFIKMGIDSIEARDPNLLVPLLAILAMVAFRFCFLTYGRFRIRRVGLRVAFHLRQLLYDQLQQQGSRFFSRYTIGDMMTRAVADIALIQRSIANGTIMTCWIIVATVYGFGFMLFLSPTLTLWILPPLPFVCIYAWSASKKLGVASRAVQDRLSDLGAHVEENLSGIRTIQAMVQEENEIHRFDSTNQGYATAFYRQAKINSVMSAVLPTLAAISSIAILGYGGRLVLDGEMTIGTFAAFFMYVNWVVQPFRMAGFVVNLYQRAAVGTTRLFEVFDKGPEISERPSGQTPAEIKGHIELRHLSFTYPGSETRVLDDINLNIAEGETIAIMGRVGSGKTTLLKQLTRLLDPPEGTVVIDGHDVHDYPIAQLRSQIAMVPQDPFLFGDPLRENITYDDPTRTIERVWQAAESADLRDTIKEFPEQMETIVGERGVTLSGGQKQRATLARGLIRNAPVLVLDDCFSAVDTETEEHILSELRRLRGALTTILVSHRVSTARHADRIVVLDGGAVSEVGSHEELLARGGFYAELERIQREGAEERDYAGVGAIS